MQTNAEISSYLNDEFVFPIRDPLWRHIYLSPGLKDIVAHPRFQKLSGIRQLGPAYLVYPGATHTRFNHSLGVFELAKRLLRTLLRSEISGKLSLDGAKAFLCAALVHDLGHFPYAHSLKELPLEEHEILTGEILLDSELGTIIRNTIKTDPEYVVAIIDLSKPAPDDEAGWYRSILSGVLDPDKLDYLNRDAYFCGVPYGIQDIDFVLSKLDFMPDIGMTVDNDGMTAVENVLFSKYLMYRTVYWHRNVRSATAMIKKAVYIGMGDGAIMPTDLYGLDDEDFSRRFSGSQHHAFRLIESVTSRQLYIPVFELQVEALSDIGAILDLDKRRVIERRIAGLYGATGENADDHVVIDIPEPISFEAELSIRKGDEIVSFPDSGTVFDRPTVAGFTRSLRKLRVFVDPTLAEKEVDIHAVFRKL